MLEEEKKKQILHMGSLTVRYTLLMHFISQYSNQSNSIHRKYC